MKKALLGIDTGTSNIKVCAFSPTGEVLCSFSHKTPTHYSFENSASFHAHELWSITETLLSQIMINLEKLGYQPVSVAVTGMGESYVGLQANDVVAEEAIMAWFDPRPITCLNLIREYEKKIGITDAVFLQTGMEVSCIFTLPKLLYAKQQNAKQFSKVRTILSVPGFITFKLCGEKVFDTSLASRTMLYDLQEKKWATELAGQLGLDASILPPLVAPAEVLGQLREEVAISTGLPRTLKVCSGGHDHFCGSFSSGLLKGSRVVDSSGTAQSIHGITDAKSNPFKKFEGFRVGQYVDNEHLYVVGGIVSSGNVYEWAANQFSTAKDLDILDAELTSKALRTSDFLHLPLFLPHLRGSGAPRWDRQSRGMFCGINEQCTRQQLLFSSIEGLAYESTSVTRKVIAALGKPVTSIVVTGGGSRNIFWQQLKASAIGLPLEITAVSESTALGVAMLGAIGIGLYKDFNQASELLGKTKAIIEPNQEVMGIMSERFALYETLYDKSISTHQAMQQIDTIYSQQESKT